MDWSRIRRERTERSLQLDPVLLHSTEGEREPSVLEFLAMLGQASLVIVGRLAGVAVWLLGGGLMVLVGALLLGSVVPFTFVVIMPTNHRLLEPGRDLASCESRALVEKWGKLHAVRSLLSLLASIVYVGLAVVG